MSTNASERIELQIGEKTFHTTKATVADSAVLSTLVELDPPEGSSGRYFVDADPGLFEHILRYLRTGMFPLFFDAARGHDYCRYLELLNQARFYQIPKLESWLAHQGYHDSVRCRTWANSITLYGEEQIAHLEELTHLKNERLHVLAVENSSARVFCCPNANWRHHGRREKCARANCLRLAAPTQQTMRTLKLDYTVTATELMDERIQPFGPEPAEPPPYDLDR
jgi:phytoene desaturase (3,4-didehydrolycopene-forming)